MRGKWGEGWILIDYFTLRIRLGLSEEVMFQMRPQYEKEPIMSRRLRPLDFRNI